MRKLRNRILQRRPLIRYRGFDSPLEYFEKHKGLQNLTPGELANIDFGLYKSLKRWEQFDEVFPGRDVGPLPQRDRENLKLLYSSCEGYAKRAVIKLQEDPNFRNLSAPTIIKYWKSSNFEIRKPGVPRILQ
jgi:hypothetical protein